MRFSISQVAKASGVSARMLRHYDAIGLLKPSVVAANGYRWYGRAELLRLQRIMVLRRLGIGLDQLGEILREQSDEAAALLSHLTQLQAERRRLDTIISTIEETIDDLDAARIQDPQRFFAGLRQDKATMRKSLAESFGPASSAAFDTAAAAQDDFTTADYEHAAAQGAALFRRLADVMRAAAAPDEPAALDAIGDHYDSVQKYWQPTPEAYSALGQLYLSDPRQRGMAEQADPELPAWLAAAIPAYAQHRLAAKPIRNSSIAPTGDPTGSATIHARPLDHGAADLQHPQVIEQATRTPATSLITTHEAPNLPKRQ
ncbi:MerR family transcriptional regulator [Amycolatopsis sp. DSM 110486]|uniref:MerR family transcriptional regulator n=1 Tax=Amycolatopsis sp. DSM 110486 TaxID=2865832 RepID=UPI001C69EFAD|nr:MerR family transcriptional regulator [Amycolatopsis sp. DSM 110486]QYN18889.1 MerR family transcriptional regulator [Amycolatopsis sp. DSM 110486]